MLKKWGRMVLISGMFFSVSQVVVAAETDPAVTKIRNSLAVLLSGMEPDSIKKSAVDGLYEVIFGPRLVYMSSDGRYLLKGSVIDLETRENLTEPRIRAAKLKAVNDIGEDNMIVYSPGEGVKTEHQVSVFTDIDCGYCRKLHSEMKQYNDAGIEIRYLFYPRAGKGSESWKKAVSVWCSDDRKSALTLAKQGQKIPEKLDCDNPVNKHLTLGGLIGVTGTPAIVLDDGKLLPGYLPPQRLKMLLDARKKSRVNRD